MDLTMSAEQFWVGEPHFPRQANPKPNSNVLLTWPQPHRPHPGLAPTSPRPHPDLTPTSPRSHPNSELEGAPQLPHLSSARLPPCKLLGLSHKSGCV
eukprot:CAMPEP_0119539918 /NCGR_PEP_ID=MMETSP1344-20130328/51945_1 /TAXON_ID=236787 /ORGANISM="Florenciella parvula, Strain CCMP2471" /LENGTH=96 /DNA_ID=CAMNT_0007583425 /DNA_START=48 /DNA_END=334 /DNA_ORIENTATION=+